MSFIIAIAVVPCWFAKRLQPTWACCMMSQAAVWILSGFSVGTLFGLGAVVKKTCIKPSVLKKHCSLLVVKGSEWSYFSIAWCLIRVLANQTVRWDNCLIVKQETVLERGLLWPNRAKKKKSLSLEWNKWVGVGTNIPSVQNDSDKIIPKHFTSEKDRLNSVNWPIAFTAYYIRGLHGQPWEVQLSKRFTHCMSIALGRSVHEGMMSTFRAHKCYWWVFILVAASHELWTSLQTTFRKQKLKTNMCHLNEFE